MREPPIRILFFSVVRQAAGGMREMNLDLERDLPAGAEVKDLLTCLEEKFPALASWRGRLLVAADQEFADLATPLRPGLEIALMPPVQGG